MNELVEKIQHQFFDSSDFSADDAGFIEKEIPIEGFQERILRAVNSQPQFDRLFALFDQNRLTLDSLAASYSLSEKKIDFVKFVLKFDLSDMFSVHSFSLEQARCEGIVSVEEETPHLISTDLVIKMNDVSFVAECDLANESFSLLFSFPESERLESFFQKLSLPDKIMPGWLKERQLEFFELDGSLKNKSIRLSLTTTSESHQDHLVHFSEATIDFNYASAQGSEMSVNGSAQILGTDFDFEMSEANGRLEEATFTAHQIELLSFVKKLDFGVPLVEEAIDKLDPIAFESLSFEKKGQTFTGDFSNPFCFEIPGLSDTLQIKIKHLEASLSEKTVTLTGSLSLFGALMDSVDLVMSGEGLSAQLDFSQMAEHLQHAIGLHGFEFVQVEGALTLGVEGFVIELDATITFPELTGDKKYQMKVGFNAMAMTLQKFELDIDELTLSQILKMAQVQISFPKGFDPELKNIEFEVAEDALKYSYDFILSDSCSWHNEIISPLDIDVGIDVTTPKLTLPLGQVNSIELGSLSLPSLTIFVEARVSGGLEKPLTLSGSFDFEFDGQKIKESLTITEPSQIMDMEKYLINEIEKNFQHIFSDSYQAFLKAAEACCQEIKQIASVIGVGVNQSLDHIESEFHTLNADPNKLGDCLKQHYGPLFPEACGALKSAGNQIVSLSSSVSSEVTQAGQSAVDTVSGAASSTASTIEKGAGAAEKGAEDLGNRIKHSWPFG